MRYEITNFAGVTQIWRDGEDITDSVTLTAEDTDHRRIAFDVQDLRPPYSPPGHYKDRPYIPGEPTTEDQIDSLATRVSALEAWIESEREHRAGDDC